MEDTVEKFTKKAAKNDHSEGGTARMLEHQTAKIPSDTYLWAAVGSMGTSLALKLMGQSKLALFIGQWAPSFLLLGTYNKLVKQEGHE